MKRILFIDCDDEVDQRRSSSPAVFSGFPDVTVVTDTGGDESDGSPGDIHGFDAVVIRALPNESRREMSLLQEAVERNIPVLGIGAGARVVAEACRGGLNVSVPGKPVWTRVTLTDEGRKDIIFFGVPASFPAFQLYGDVPSLPENILNLALSESDGICAFRYRNAYGIDFHIALSAADSQDIDGRAQGADRAGADEGEKDDMIVRSRTILGNFLWLIELCRSSKPVRNSDGPETAVL